MPDAAVAARSSEIDQQRYDATGRCRRRRRRVCRPLSPASPAQGRLLGGGDRGGRRRRRHLVLEPLSRRTLRHPDHRLQLHVRSRTRDARGHWSEKYATQPEILRYFGFVADRYDLRRDIRFGTKVKAANWDDSSGALAARHRQRRERILPLLHHGHRLPLRAKAAGDRRRQGFQGRGLFHRPLAA